MLRALERYFDQFDMPATSDVVDQVECLVLRMMPIPRCRLPLIAEQLGMHVRMLQRRLAEEGRSFDEVVETLRRERVDHYLAERRTPKSQVAGLFGLANSVCSIAFVGAGFSCRRGPGVASCWNETD